MEKITNKPIDSEKELSEFEEDLEFEENGDFEFEENLHKIHIYKT